MLFLGRRLMEAWRDGQDCLDQIVIAMLMLLLLLLMMMMMIMMMMMRW
jgi:hypothetical protein